MQDIDVKVVKNIAREASSVTEAAKIMGLSRTRFREMMKNNGLHTDLRILSEKGARGTCLDKAKVCTAVERAQSLVEAARELEVSTKTLRKFLRENNLKTLHKALVERGIKSRTTHSNRAIVSSCEPKPITRHDCGEPKRVTRYNRGEKEILQQEIVEAEREKGILPPFKEELSESFWVDLEGRLKKLDSQEEILQKVERPSTQRISRLTKIVLDIYEEQD